MNTYLSLKLKVISFLLIVMIVYVHSYNLDFHINLAGSELKGYSSFLQYFISQGIFRLPTPIFFIVSGYLFFLSFNGEPNEFILKIKKRLRTIGLPYLLWSLWGLSFYYFLQLIPASSSFFKNQLIRDYSAAQFLNTIFFDPIPGQLWYLRDLIILSFLSPIIYYLIKKLKFFVVIIFLCTWFYDFDFYLLSNRAVLFFIFGAFLSLQNNKLLSLKFSRKLWVYTFLGIFIILIKTTLVYSNYRNLFVIEALHKVGILLGIWTIWNLYDYFYKTKDWTKSKLYKFIPFTFFIYVFHEPVLTIFKKILYYILGQSEFVSLFIFLVGPVITIFFSLLIAYCFKRIIPGFYYLLTGDR